MVFLVVGFLTACRLLFTKNSRVVFTFYKTRTVSVCVRLQGNQFRKSYTNSVLTHFAPRADFQLFYVPHVLR